MLPSAISQGRALRRAWPLIPVGRWPPNLKAGARAELYLTA